MDIMKIRSTDSLVNKALTKKSVLSRLDNKPTNNHTTFADKRNTCVFNRITGKNCVGDFFEKNSKLTITDKLEYVLHTTIAKEDVDALLKNYQSCEIFKESKSTKQNGNIEEKWKESKLVKRLRQEKEELMVQMNTIKEELAQLKSRQNEIANSSDIKSLTNPWTKPLLIMKNNDMLKRNTHQHFENSLEKIKDTAKQLHLPQNNTIKMYIDYENTGKTSNIDIFSELHLDPYVYVSYSKIEVKIYHKPQNIDMTYLKQMFKHFGDFSYEIKEDVKKNDLKSQSVVISSNYERLNKIVDQLQQLNVPVIGLCSNDLQNFTVKTLFSELEKLGVVYDSMNFNFNSLLTFIAIRWLSRGRALKRLLILKSEVILFL
ncbi:hypothetical protein A3Q56_04703 [Intoshia linei]|uniref:Uncharacterized protein n=1 Tax=Intoshia linei TaxID=1819745 RepID=A0A177B2A1_9BILA|nr:hypothetical protein A3Q56_04703 [Intoshia linei]